MSDADVRQPVPAWLWGGGLLVAGAMLPTLGQPLAHTPTVVWGSRLLTAAALIVFALGLRGAGSVVARRPVGVIALFCLALGPPAIDLVTSLLTLGTDSAMPENLGMWQLIGYAGLALSAAAALVAVIEIARARVVPDPWRWAPTWGLAVAAGVFVLGQVAIVAVGAQGAQEYADLIVIGSAVGTVLVPLALGILAMVLGARGRVAAPAQVYPPA